MTSVYSTNGNTNPYIETFKGVDGFYAVDMSHLSVEQAVAVRKLATDGGLTQTGLTGIIDSGSFVSISLEELWALPEDLHLNTADGEDINPTLLAMLCLQLLQDTQQDLRKFFMENMFLNQTTILDTARKEKDLSDKAANTAYASSLINAVCGLVGASLQVGASAGGAASLHKIKGYQSEAKGLETKNVALRSDIETLGKPGPKETLLALEETALKQQLKDAPGDNALQTRLKTATSEREALTDQRHAALQIKRDELASNENRVTALKVHMDSSNNLANLAVRTGTAVAAVVSDSGQMPAAAEKKTADLASSEANYMAAVRATQSADYDFANAMSQGVENNFNKGGDVASAIIGSAASTYQATARAMA